MIKTLTRVTKSPKAGETRGAWFHIDAKGQVLGRLASKSAAILVGKNEATFTPGVNFGRHVLITNAKHISVTGRKEGKTYFRHSGYPGGVKVETLSSLRQSNPERIIRQSVVGMLPKNRLGKALAKNLHIFRDASHTYDNQSPMEVKIERS
jgi:large subunit ribosomal protein L13